MRPRHIITLLLCELMIIDVTSVSVGIIHNTSLHIWNTNPIIIYGTCEECVCSLLTNTTFFSLNCASDIFLCELHSKVDQNKSFSLTTANSASFYFLSLPAYIRPQVVTGNYLWSFDGTFQDNSSTFNGTPNNDASFSPSAITGYGSSLSLNASMNQFVSIHQPYLKLYDHSWTFEVWIYLSIVESWFEYPILQQRESPTSDSALHLAVRDRRLLLGFISDDLSGVTNLTASRWYHTAFVFDTVTGNQSIYLHGVLDATRQMNSSYPETSGVLNIGISYWGEYATHFDGLIDKLSFTNRSKTPEDILRDATLTLHFSFDGNSTSDEGPLSINGSLGGATSFVPGWRNQALQIENVNDSYLAVEGLVLLGTSDRSYSFSIWIKPAIQQRSTIIHMSSVSDGTGWCLPMIGLTNESQLIATSWNSDVVRVEGPIVPMNSWTHVVSTYSFTQGLRLYANGSKFGGSAAFSFNASGSPNYLFVGSSRAGIDCVALSDINGQYSGAVDELYVYSRELTPSEISALAKP